jgi:hypothetical protein
MAPSRYARRWSLKTARELLLIRQRRGDSLLQSLPDKVHRQCPGGCLLGRLHTFYTLFRRTGLGDILTSSHQVDDAVSLRVSPAYIALGRVTVLDKTMPSTRQVMLRVFAYLTPPGVDLSPKPAARPPPEPAPAGTSMSSHLHGSA